MRFIDKLFCGGGFQFPVATTSCNKHCDLSVTTSGGQCTLIGVLSTKYLACVKGVGEQSSWRFF